jgi:thiamine biosynthesis lipoprotein
MHSSANAEPFERKVFAMGTELSISLEGVSRKQAVEHSEAVLKLVRTAENRLSTWKADSELSHLNLSPVNQSIVLSPELSSDLRGAVECETETNRAFSPALAPLVKAWGMRTGGKQPADSEWKSAFLNSGTKHFQFTLNAGTNTLSVTKKSNHAGFEEGGFGKGAALDEAIAYLKKNGVKDALLNFGGQIAMITENAKTVEVADPSDRQRKLLTFRTDAPSIATSSNSVHRNVAVVNGRMKTIGHLLNPLNGKPIEHGGSITVLHSSALKADCRTKVFVLGAKRALDWANRNQERILILRPGSRKGQWIAETSCDWNAPLDADISRLKWIKPTHCKKEKERTL